MIKQLIHYLEQVPASVYRFLLLVTAVVICILAFSSTSLPSPVQGHDKLSHFSAFFVLAWLVHHALQLKYWQQLLLLMGYGLFIEIVQSFLPNRFASGYDLLADLAGVCCFWCFNWLFHRFNR